MQRTDTADDDPYWETAIMTSSMQAQHVEVMIEAIRSELDQVTDQLVTLIKRYGLSKTTRKTIFSLIDRQTELQKELHRWLNELPRGEHGAQAHQKQARPTPPTGRPSRPRQG